MKSRNRKPATVRSTIRPLLALVLFAGLTACSRDPERVEHLLLICTDTVRFDTFMRLGDRPDDPLRDWVDRAVVFEDASAAAPWTAPSLATALTGLWPNQHGAGLFPEPVARLDEQIPSALFEDVPLFTEALAGAGFTNTVVSAHAMTDGKISALGLDRGIHDTHHFGADWRQMVEFLSNLLRGREQGGARHYDLLHLMEAHNWHIADTEELDRRVAVMPADTIDRYVAAGPRGVCADTGTELCRRYLVYASAVEQMRAAIAQTLSTLEESGRLADTLVVMLSDHGEEFGDHAGDSRIRQRSEEVAYIGHGHSLYQELLHVPLIVWHPALPAQRVAAPVGLIDLAPSLAEWLDVAFQPPRWGGRSLQRAIDGDSTEPRRLYATALAYGEQQIATREGDAKAVWHTVTDAFDYFDLSADPGETDPSGPDEWVWYFDTVLSDFLALTPTDRIQPASLSDEQIRRLQAIGYLQGVEVDEE